jgi:hypothetical protein
LARYFPIPAVPSRCESPRLDFGTWLRPSPVT